MNEQPVRPESGAALERHADFARSRLMHTLERLDRKRHELGDPKVLLARHKGALLAAGGLLLLAAAGIATAGLIRRRGRPQRLRAARLHALAELWRKPELLERKARPSVLVEIARRILIGTVTAAGVTLARRQVERLAAPGPLPAYELPP